MFLNICYIMIEGLKQKGILYYCLKMTASSETYNNTN